MWAEVWVVCAGQNKTPGGTHDTAGLSWHTDQEGSMKPVSGNKHHTMSLAHVAQKQKVPPSKVPSTQHYL